MASEVVAQLDGEALVAALASQLAAMRGALRSGNEAAHRFPTDIVAMLRRLGVLVAPLPRHAGGFGWGTEAAGISALCETLRILGHASLAAGRIFEAHVNAIALLFRYGDAVIRTAAAGAVRSGQLFALWVAPAKEPVRAIRHGTRLHVTGRKAYCTAAGIADRAVITALTEQDGEQMILVDTTEAVIDSAAPVALHGMGGTSTKAVTFDCMVPPEHCIGETGDYLREPEFSVGAWRTSAVTVGGLQALVEETILQLRTRDRHTNPHQAARVGQMLIQLHNASDWVRSAARRSVSHQSDPRHLTGYVNLARIAIEQCCLEVIPLVQRSLGLPGLLADNPVEPMMRDLVTYLRQPAGDEALVEAAVTFAEAIQPASLGDLL
jgi:hypothetical protein